MIGWIILAVYVLGYVASVKPLAEADLDSIITRAERKRDEDRALYPHSWETLHPEGGGDIVPSAWGRRTAAWCGLVKAIVWPLTLLVLSLSHHLTAPIERQRVAERELARIKAFAKREGLEYPEAEK